MAKKHASLFLKTAPSLLYGILTMLLYIALFGWILLFLYCTAMQNFQLYVLKKEIFNFFRWTYLELNTNLNRIIIFPPHFFYILFLGMSCPPLPNYYVIYYRCTFYQWWRRLFTEMHFKEKQRFNFISGCIESLL